jgi:hypothetical protein
VLVAAIGAASTLAIDAVSFAGSALAMLFVRRRLRAERGDDLPRLVRDVREGVAFVWRSRLLRAIIAYWTVVAVATAGIVPTLSYYITIDRDFGAALFGSIGSAWSVGYLVGSLVAGRLVGERAGLRMLAMGVGIGAPLVAMAVSASAAVYLGGAFVVGGALAILLVSYATLRAAATPDAFLGRVGSTARTFSVGLQPLGLLAAGAIIDAASGGAALAAIGAVTVAASLVFAMSRGVRGLTTSSLDVGTTS